MTPNHIELSAEQILHDSKAILVGQITKPVYINNKKTDALQNVAIVVSPASDMDKVTVKLTGNNPLPISNEELSKRTCALNFVWVKFVGFTGKIYTDNTGRPAISCRADSIEIVNAKS